VEEPPVAIADVDPAVEAYVASAEATLWSPVGEPARQWLFARGIGEEVLRANRVGFDPGPKGFYRPRGLPNWRVTHASPGGPGVVYPVLSAEGRVVYFQTRYLDPAAAGRDKYENPWSSLAVNPRVAAIRIPSPDPAMGGFTLVTEGIPDGLVVAQTGAAVAAVVGAGNYGHEVARHISHAFPTGRLAVVWDADHGGRRGACILAVRLVALGRDVVVSTPPPEHNDIGDWWKAEPHTVAGTVASFRRPALYVPELAFAGGPARPTVRGATPLRAAPPHLGLTGIDNP
jgi:hypothetical protein